ncbi:c-type cytochrome [Rhodoflexus caldus]|uniref:c-type cytochrome n=1 Tax=Rhodoflexus caldus TaxID=2891236 RepID=UPI00202A839C|nr:cytochrome c [Rhodoflexus caldus]
MKKLLLSAAFSAIGLSLFSFTLLQDDAMKQSMKRGETVYATNCANCHMAQGEGIPGAIPPLAKSDYLMKDQRRAIRQIIYGAKGEMTVNGVKYNNEMPGQNHLTDQEIADVLNYVQNSWGNKQPKMVTAIQVKPERSKKQ